MKAEHFSAPHPRLITAIAGQYPGTALVIGGGPSVPAQLAELRRRFFTPAVVLSANEHGHHQQLYPVTYSVCNDDRHGESKLPMRVVLQPSGRPIVGAMPWCDYRIPEWVLAANCGLACIVVAMLLGAGSVVLAGIDCYRALDPKAATYYHDPEGVSNSTRKQPKNFHKQVLAVKDRIQGAVDVRPVVPAGSKAFLETYWPAWRANEVLRARPRANDYVDYVRGLEEIIVEAGSRGFPIQYGQVQPGTRLAVSREEARRFCGNRSARRVDLPAPPRNGTFRPD